MRLPFLGNKSLNVTQQVITDERVISHFARSSDRSVRYSIGGGCSAQRRVGITYSAPARTPVGQRAVIVLRRV